MCAESRFAKPRNSLHRETGCYFLRCAKSNTKSTCSDVQKVASGKFLCVGDRWNRENCERMWARRPCFKESTPSCDLGSKLYRLYFFVTFPALVPTPAYGATRFFGCFEPVRKGCCSTDARLMFFKNGMSYCKLTGACRIQKGWLLVIFVAVRICFFRYVD